ncbi:MAG: hypothetical protein JRN62_06090 [Nitrososphaerota archaeon]|jgi:hypothetical protein|nr:hypothetical protein [Nitrososphaerota archaeon]
MPEDNITRTEYEARQRDFEARFKEVIDRFDKLTEKVEADHNLFLEWKGRALLMMYVIPILTGVIGFLLGIRS